MGIYSDRLLQEFDGQWAQLRQAEEIVLYGKNDVSPVMRLALKELGAVAAPHVFDAGRFADGGSTVPQCARVVILCGMRARTREDMKKDAAVFFPGAPCFDYLAVYYQWLRTCVKRDCDMEVLAETLLAVREERTTHNIDSINTTHCSLNCRECSNGMQVRSDKKVIDLDRHIRSLERLTAVRPISYCNMQGGEPLLDRELVRRIRLHAANPRVAFFTMATNGTVVPDDNVMKAMRQAGMMLRISDYGELSRCKQELVRKTETFSVPCDMYKRAETWVAYGPYMPHGRTEEENRTVADRCHFGTKDLMLYDGYLFSCCRTLFADALGVHDEATERNTLNVMEPFSEEELDVITAGKELHRMCDHCDYPMKVVPAGEQAERKRTSNR